MFNFKKNSDAIERYGDYISGHETQIRDLRQRVVVLEERLTKAGRYAKEQDNKFAMLEKQVIANRVEMLDEIKKIVKPTPVQAVLFKDSDAKPVEKPPSIADAIDKLNMVPERTELVVRNAVNYLLKFYGDSQKVADAIGKSKPSISRWRSESSFVMPTKTSWATIYKAYVTALLETKS